MRRAQQHVEGGEQGLAGGAGGRGIFFAAPQHGLGELQVPVAVLAPGEFVNRIRIQVEAVVAYRAFDIFDQPPGAGAYPAVRETERRRPLEIGVLDVHEDELCRVPQLVAEVSIAVDPTQVEVHVASGRGREGAVGEPQRVGAVGADALRKVGPGRRFDVGSHLRLGQVGGAFCHQVFERDAIDDVQRIEDIALGLRHLGAVRVPYQPVRVDGPEWHVTGEAQRHHDHSSDPEENDVVPGDQDIGGVEAFELARGFRPAQSSEGPQRRTEPGVEYVVIPRECGAVGYAAFFPRLAFVPADVRIALVVVPRRNAVPPP